MTMTKIIRIQASGPGMLFKDKRGLPETGGPDTSGQSGQSGADNDKLIISQQRSDGKVSQLPRLCTVTPARIEGLWRTVASAQIRGT